MGRSRQSERTRRQRSAARKGRTSAGQPMSNLDWQCPHCAQWFSQKRNGPGNHLRFCKAHRLCQSSSRLHQQRNPMPRVHETIITDSSDSDSLSSSCSESDMPVTHRRRAQQVRSSSAAETCEYSHASWCHYIKSLDKSICTKRLPLHRSYGTWSVDWPSKSAFTTWRGRSLGWVSSSFWKTPWNLASPRCSPVCCSCNAIWCIYTSLASIPYSSRLWASRAIPSLWLHGFIHRWTAKTHPFWFTARAQYNTGVFESNACHPSSDTTHRTSPRRTYTQFYRPFSGLMISILVQNSWFEVPYPKQKARNYFVRFRESILSAILDILEDEHLQDRICLYPERRYMRRPGPAGGIMRLWEEYSSGDDWWDVQVSLASYVTTAWFMFCLLIPDTYWTKQCDNLSSALYWLNTCYVFRQCEILGSVSLDRKCPESRP